MKNGKKNCNTRNVRDINQKKKKKLCKISELE